MNTGLPVVLVFRSTLLGGSETFIREQARHLRRYRPVFVGLYRAAGLDLGGFPSHAVADAGGWRCVVAKNLNRYPVDLIATLSALRPALLHAHFGTDGVLALPLAQALGIPLVVTYHGVDASVPVACASRPWWTWPRWMPRYVHGRRRLRRGTTRVVAVSQRVRDLVIAQGFPAERVVVRYIGVELTPGATPADRDPANLLFVGRLVAKKGVLGLIRAFVLARAAIPALRLAVIGSGPDLASARDLAHAAQAAIEFPGFLPHAEVRARMRAAGAVVVPSRTGPDGDEEGVPTVVLEAFASGCPVVGTCHAGIPEVVTDEVNGLLVPEGDDEALARALIRLAGDRLLHTRLAAGASATAADFAIGERTALLEDTYDAVVADGRTRPG